MFEIDSAKYYTVFYWMIDKLGLKGGELSIFAIIYGFSQDQESEFFGSLSYLETFTGLSRPTVVAVLSSLEEKELIIKNNFYRGKIKRNSYTVNSEKVNELLKSS
jgi:DNA-binding MarR family transcriptional regulator